MRLPVPAVQRLKELNQGFDLRIINVVGEDGLGFNGLTKGARRFAPGLLGGVPPRTPASFRLRHSRFAGLWVEFGVCRGLKLDWRASR